METNHEHIKISGLQKLSAILHLGSPSSGSMTEAWDEAHTYPRTLLSVLQKRGYATALQWPDAISLNPAESSGQRGREQELHIWDHHLLTEASL